MAKVMCVFAGGRRMMEARCGAKMEPFTHARWLNTADFYAKRASHMLCALQVAEGESKALRCACFSSVEISSGDITFCCTLRKKPRCFEDIFPSPQTPR